MIVYRFLSGDDTSAFCHKVTANLARGWQLYGPPVYAFDGGGMRCGQAVTKEVEGEYRPDMTLGEL